MPYNALEEPSICKSHDPESPERFAGRD